VLDEKSPACRHAGALCFFHQGVGWRYHLTCIKRGDGDIGFFAGRWARQPL
jgi:hypothetical protein